MKKKVVIFVTKKSLFTHSGVGKYISGYIPFLDKNYELEVYYQPENMGMLKGLFWRLFKLPSIIKKRYGDYKKIFFDENFLISIRKSYALDSIVIVHHYPFLTKVNNLKEHLVRYLSFFTFNTILKKVGHIVTVSKMTQGVLIDRVKIPSNRISLIYNSIDISQYFILGEEQKGSRRKELSDFFSLPIDKKWIFYVGSNESRKNMPTLYRMFNQLDEKYVLIRVGKNISPSEEDILNQILDQGTKKDQLFWLQNLAEEDLIGLYQTADIGIMPSLYEGFGRPIIEMQACGLPVITTKMGSLEEVAGAGALFVEDPYDTSEFIGQVSFLEGMRGEDRQKLIIRGQKNAHYYDTKNNEKIRKTVL